MATHLFAFNPTMHSGARQKTNCYHGCIFVGGVAVLQICRHLVFLILFVGSVFREVVGAWDYYIILPISVINQVMIGHGFDYQSVHTRSQDKNAPPYSMVFRSSSTWLFQKPPQTTRAHEKQEINTYKYIKRYPIS